MGNLTAHGVGIGACYATAASLSPTFGYATVIALSQSGAQAAESSYVAGSAVQVQASYFDQYGNPLIPASVKWTLMQMSDAVVDCCNELTPWVSITPAAVNLISVPAAKNTMVSYSRQSERHAVLVQIIDAAGNVNYARGVFTVTRVCGAPLTLQARGETASVGAEYAELT